MSSSDQEFQSLRSLSSGNIDELQGVSIAGTSAPDIARNAITPFGSDASKLFVISDEQLNTLEGKADQQFEYNSEQQQTFKRQKTAWGKELTDLLCDKLITSIDEYDLAIKSDPVVRKFNREHAHCRGFKTVLMSACETAYKELPDKTFEERVMEVANGTGEAFEKACNEWIDFVNETFKSAKLLEIFEVMNMQKGKIKTVYLYGTASGGKSAIIDLIQSVYRTSEVGRAGAQAINSNFWLEDMIGKRLAILEEVVCNQVNVESVKQLMEGNKNSHSNVKYEKSRMLLPMPVLMAANVEITKNCQAHTAAIMARCIRIEFNAVTKRNLYYDDDMMRKILKRLYMSAYAKQTVEQVSAEPDLPAGWKRDAGYIFDENGIMVTDGLIADSQ